MGDLAASVLVMEEAPRVTSVDREQKVR